MRVWVRHRDGRQDYLDFGPVSDVTAARLLDGLLAEQPASITVVGRSSLGYVA